MSPALTTTFALLMVPASVPPPYPPASDLDRLLPNKRTVQEAINLSDKYQCYLTCQRCLNPNWFESGADLAETRMLRSRRVWLLLEQMHYYTVSHEIPRKLDALRREIGWARYYGGVMPGTIPINADWRPDIKNPIKVPPVVDPLDHGQTD